MGGIGMIGKPERKMSTWETKS